MADSSHMEHSGDYDIIDSEYDDAMQNGTRPRTKADGYVRTKRRGSEPQETEEKERTAAGSRVANGNPNYLAHLKKREGNVAVRPASSSSDGKSNGEQKPRMTADELIKIASTAMQEVDEKEKRDMASRRGMASTKPSSCGTAFQGFKPEEDTEKLDFKSVLRKSIRKTNPVTNSKKSGDKPEWTQQKRTIKVNEIENRVGKPKGGANGPEWADKVHSSTARLKVTELEHKRVTSHNAAETPEWACKVPKDSKGVLAKTEQRFKSRQTSDDRPNYRGVLKASNPGAHPKESSGMESD